MVTQSLCFRFDVDTPRCLIRGMPLLLDLANELDIHFTFYVNPGRAVLRRPMIKDRRHQTSPQKLSALRKLGIRDYVYIATRNPLLSDIDQMSVIVRAVDEGHDVGLHGGQNHAEWQRHAHNWAESKTRAEIEFGLDALKRLGVESVGSFASPGWNTPPGLARILPDYGIEILADRHGAETDSVEREARGEALQVPTIFAGEPGGIGYLEWLTARGLNRERALSHFTTQLDAESRQFAVLYDHPCFAGIEALALLREMIVHCKRAGTYVMTLTDIVDSGRAQRAAAGDPPRDTAATRPDR